MEAFKTQASIECVSTRKDKTCKITIGTQELSPDQKKDLFSVGDFGWFIFAPFEMEQVEIPTAPGDVAIKNKSPSRRLREVIFRYFESIGGTDGDKKFDDFYASQIEVLIERYKNAINK